MKSAAGGSARPFIDKTMQIAPGLALALGLAVAAHALAPYAGAGVLKLQGLDPARAASPVSGILVAVVLGLIIRNVLGLPRWMIPGVDFAMKPVLRLGIVLLGIRLSLLDALRIGAWGIPIVAITVAAGIGVTTWISRRLNQPGRLGTLIAASTAICGVTAVVATAPAIDAEDREITYAVATVTIFGLAAMVVYPYLGFWLFGGDAVKAGLFMGTAIHETAQVAGAGLIYSQVFQQPRALDVATVTKLLRNVFLVAVVPVLALMYSARAARPGGSADGTSGPSDAGGARPGKPGFSRLFPTFVLGFLAFALIRTAGDSAAAGGALALGIFDAGTWASLTGRLANFASVYLLGTAMAGVGLNSSIKVLRELGGRPFIVGLVSAVVVGGVAVALAFTFGGRIGF